MAGALGSYTTSTTSTASTSWLYWNTSATTITTASTWSSWLNSGTSLGGLATRAAATPQTQLAESEGWGKVKTEQEEANARAKALLREQLTKEQLEDFEKDESFVVVGKQFQYRITKGWAGNIKCYSVTDRLKLLAKLCAHPSDYSIPHYDNMLVQKLYLECAEEEFLGIANISAA